MPVANTWGTLTNTRSTSVRMMWNSSRLVAGLSAVIRSPVSTLRAVMTPGKGAVIFSNAWRSVNRWTAASLT
jgi:hypothetical protein